LYVIERGRAPAKARMRSGSTRARQLAYSFFLEFPRENSAFMLPYPMCMNHAAFFLGTFAPFLRASERPIAMACLRLFTVPPFPPLPDLSVPLFSRCTALFTDLLAALPYFLPEPERLLVAIVPPFIDEKQRKENELRPKNGPFNRKRLSCANFRKVLHPIQ
jgi:hypothetical protein